MGAAGRGERLGPRTQAPSGGRGADRGARSSGLLSESGPFLATRGRAPAEAEEGRQVPSGNRSSEWGCPGALGTPGRRGGVVSAHSSGTPARRMGVGGHDGRHVNPAGAHEGQLPAGQPGQVVGLGACTEHVQQMGECVFWAAGKQAEELRRRREPEAEGARPLQYWGASWGWGPGGGGWRRRGLCCWGSCKRQHGDRGHSPRRRPAVSGKGAELHLGHGSSEVQRDGWTEQTVQSRATTGDSIPEGPLDEEASGLRSGPEG